MATTRKHLSHLRIPGIMKQRNELSTSYVDENGKTVPFEEGDIVEYASDAVNVASIVATASGTFDLADATGVRIGDVVLGVSAMVAAGDPMYNAQLIYTAKVVANDTIRVILGNIAVAAGAAVDPGSSVFVVVVMKMV